MALIYSEFTDWYHLLDPVADHAREAGVYRAHLERALSEAKTLLELGAGAGNNALHWKHRFTCTLTDVSAQMLELSRRQNPECEHLVGDMCTLRLGRTFDVVLAHDAVMYLTSEAQLAAAAQTAFLHTRRGGVTLFLPDMVKETFTDETSLYEADDGTKSLRTLEWSWDPDPADDQCMTEYVFVMREHGQVRTVHDRHLQGLFTRAQWVRALSSAGFEVEASEHEVDDDTVVPFFLGRRA